MNLQTGLQTQKTEVLGPGLEGSKVTMRSGEVRETQARIPALPLPGCDLGLLPKLSEP